MALTSFETVSASIVEAATESQECSSICHSSLIA